MRYIVPTYTRACGVPVNRNYRGKWRLNRLRSEEIEASTHSLSLSHRRVGVGRTQFASSDLSNNAGVYVIHVDSSITRAIYSRFSRSIGTGSQGRDRSERPIALDRTVPATAGPDGKCPRERFVT